MKVDLEQFRQQAQVLIGEQAAGRWFPPGSAEAAPFYDDAPQKVLALLDQLDAARSCIHHLANRIAESPDLAYHFDPLTRSTELLKAAVDALFAEGSGAELVKRILASIARRRR